MSDIERMLGEYVDLMEIKNRQIVPPIEAEYRASLFLTACAHAINWRATYAELLHNATARAEVSYKIALFQANGRNVTEAKIVADADPDNQAAQIKVRELESKVDYFQTYYQLFMNAHIFYRQMASQIYKEARNGL